MAAVSSGQTAEDAKREARTACLSFCNSTQTRFLFKLVPQPNESPAQRVQFGTESQGSGADGDFYKKPPEQSELCSGMQ